MSPDFRDDASANRLLRAAQIYEGARRLPPEERPAYIDRACAGDSVSRRLVELLLSEHGGSETGSYPIAPSEQRALQQAPAPREHIPMFDQQPVIPGYEIVEEISRGPMGAVYKARQPDLKRFVALKLMAPPAEAIDVAHLDHPHIVPVYEVGEWHPAEGPPVPYFAMKWYSLGSLAREPAGPGTDPVAHARVVAIIARAVHHAHQRGLLHRDLKPSNILLDADGSPHVADFGLALRMEGARAVTRSGYIAGTVQYMAPEQADGAPDLTTAVDVYGLGAILYALLTGGPPFENDDFRELLRQVSDRNSRPAPPPVDPDLRAVCMKCLDKNPDGRYPSAESLAQDLELWLAGKETGALKWDRPYRLLRLIKRNRVTSALIGAAVLLAMLWDGVNSRERLADRESQVLRSNAYTARSVARTVEERVQLWSSAVTRESRDESLRAHLKQKDRAALEKQVARAHAYYATPASGFVREAGVPPFASWFVMDERGEVVAHAGSNAKVEGAFPWRDYFRGASGKPDGFAYVSRVYHSHLAGEYYKFAIAVPIRDGGALAGVLVATVMTDSAEETLLPGDAPQKAVLVGRWDGNPPDKPVAAVRADKHPPGQRLILLHSAFERGHVAAEVHNEKLFDSEEFRNRRYCLDDRYEDPVTRAKTNDAGRWLAASAPVNGTEFVVIVQQDYAGAVRPNAIILRPLILWGVVALAVLVCGAAMLRSARLRSRGGPTEPTPGRGDSGSTVSRSIRTS